MENPRLAHASFPLLVSKGNCSDNPRVGQGLNKDGQNSGGRVQEGELQPPGFSGSAVPAQTLAVSVWGRSLGCLYVSIAPQEKENKDSHLPALSTWKLGPEHSWTHPRGLRLELPCGASPGECRKLCCLLLPEMPLFSERQGLSLQALQLDCLP